MAITWYGSQSAAEGCNLGALAMLWPLLERMQFPFMLTINSENMDREGAVGSGLMAIFQPWNQSAERVVGNRCRAVRQQEREQQKNRCTP